MFRNLCLSSCLLLISIYLHAQQNPVVDSLFAQLHRATTDTTKAKLYSRLSDLYIDINLDQAKQYADSSLTLAKNAKWPRGIADGQLSFGNVYNFNGHPEEAHRYLLDAIDGYRKINHVRGEGTALYALGQSYERTSDFPKALQYFLEALTLHESRSHSDWDIAMCLSGISVIYYLQADYQKSLDYSFKALAKKELLKNKTGVANEFYNIGDTYLHMGDSTNAVTYNLRALKSFEELNNLMGQGNASSSLGKLYRKDHQKAIEYLNRARQSFFEWDSLSPSVLTTEGQLGQVYLDLAASDTNLPSAFITKYSIPVTRAALLAEAKSLITKALDASLEMGDKDTEHIFRADLAEVFAQTGDYKNAYTQFRLYHHLHDSLYSQENKNKIAGLEGEREIALRDQQIEINRQALRVQRTRQFVLITGIGLLAVIGLLLYRQSRMRKKSNAVLSQLNLQLQEANLRKAKFFAILSHDLRGPVARLINFLHLQKEAPDLLTAEQTEVHQVRIAESAENLLENMENILLWSKGQMEEFKPTFRTLRVHELFQEVVKTFAHIPSISITYQSPEDLIIFSDENFVTTILRNLTSNAIQALINTTQPNIVWTGATHIDGVTLAIKDNGPGMDEDTAKRLLTNTEIGSGSRGMGFHIVNDMANAIGCIIRVESSANGTTIHIHFNNH